MANRIEFTGLEELRAALKQLPEELAREADDIIDNRTELALSEIIQRYPRRTGNLRKGVRKKKIRDGWQLRNTAAHSHLFERGTQARHTKIGAHRGAMPPGNVFVPVAIKHRRLMEQELIDLLVRKGFGVTGAR